MISWWSNSKAVQKCHLRASSGNFCVSTSGHEVCVSADVTTTDINMTAQSDPALLSRRFLTALLVLLQSGSHAEPEQDPRPSFVLMMVDDLGIGDIGCYGNHTIRFITYWFWKWRSYQYLLPLVLFQSSVMLLCLWNTKEEFMKKLSF